MDRQYCAINECLRLVRESHLPTCKRLRAEIRLIQIKRLLLNDSISHSIRSDAFSEGVFEDLLSSIRTTCSRDGDHDDLTGLIDDVGTMLATLDCHPCEPTVPTNQSAIFRYEYDTSPNNA